MFFSEPAKLIMQMFPYFGHTDNTTQKGINKGKFTQQQF